MTTLEIQRRLKALGYDPGPQDGVPGRLTIRAIKDFQAKHGLAVDGLAGPQTIAALSPRNPTPSPSPQEGGESLAGMRPWYEEAVRLEGTREAGGAADNPVILRWARALRLGYRHDATAWCGLFVAHCIAATLPDEPLPNNPLGARNWLRFGAPCEATLGAVLVFWRGGRGGWQGHVGFYAGEDATALHVLGGNQADQVSIARLAKDRLIGARWPATAPHPATLKIHRDVGEALSRNEA